MGIVEILKGEEDISIQNPLTGDTILSVPNPIRTAQQMYDSVTSWINNLQSLFQGIFGKVGEWISAAVQSVISLPGKLIGGVTDAVGGVAANAGSGIAGMAQSVFSSITSGISNAFHRFWDNLSSIWRKDDE